MGITAVEAHRKPKTTRKSKMAAGIKVQQAHISKEADEWWKVDIFKHLAILYS